MMGDGRQSRIDAVDAEMRRRLLPDAAVEAIDEWWHRRKHADGNSVAGHTNIYRPDRWVGVAPWPASLADRGSPGEASVTREQVVESARTAAGSGRWQELVVACYVWGWGKRGTRAGSGPTLLREHVLPSAARLDKALADAVRALRESRPEQAYQVLDQARITQFGPSFFTKFLYFADCALPGTPGPDALILDTTLARTLGRQARAVGAELGVDPNGGLADHAWGKDGRRRRWSSHRYCVYLTWMAAASRQLADAVAGWPEDGRPDLLELALFQGAWQG
ncbi:8-oxoguanine DNA glycosylase OGG fold protein [Streptacidiphilus fuscans]|uniref:Uncharacterized protein n=1 Tax=Streptacidiphilus fuscans TaxID=2789292 RepID=A0A931BFH6_9ACTN|nr:hypothetical protein [Streptacidiphilus fuscans]MBF9072510.1 hypothetical protein [Streptacidiphilus fuscans]